jgi:HAD superfamily hydrolase (TIGR01509 family)
MYEKPFVLFDFDGTLMDSVYADVLAWQEAYIAHGYSVPSWRIHRLNGAQGSLVRTVLRRDLGIDTSDDEFAAIVDHAIKAYHRFSHLVQPAPGAQKILHKLNELDIPWAIATSGNSPTLTHLLGKIGVDPHTATVVTRDNAKYAKPSPEIFLQAADLLGFPMQRGYIIGDSVWDMLAAKRAGGTAIGVRTGGYGDEELFQKSAIAVYDDLNDLCAHLPDVGILP